MVTSRKDHVHNVLGLQRTLLVMSSVRIPLAALTCTFCRGPSRRPRSVPVLLDDDNLRQEDRGPTGTFEIRVDTPRWRRVWLRGGALGESRRRGRRGEAEGALDDLSSGLFFRTLVKGTFRDALSFEVSERVEDERWDGRSAREWKRVSRVGPDVGMCLLLMLLVDRCPVRVWGLGGEFLIRKGWRVKGCPFERVWRGTACNATKVWSPQVVETPRVAEGEGGQADSAWAVLFIVVVWEEERRRSNEEEERTDRHCYNGQEERGQRVRGRIEDVDV